MRRARFQGAFGGGFPSVRTARAAECRSERLSSSRPKQQEDRGLNENYGREVMELHTVGVDAGYTQQDVIEMAEVPYRLDRSRSRGAIRNSFSTTGISRRGEESR